MPSASKQPLILARAGHFFAGGSYVETPDGRVMNGQMYVRELVPAEVSRPYPVVMIHGTGQTGTNYEATPDGREGWAFDFVRAGYAVYVVDQPARGRSAYHADLEGPMPRHRFGSVEGIVSSFIAPSKQWPGKGEPGDPSFDQFFASQVPSLATATGRPELLARDAAAALLDRIGPAILLTHSQSGAFGWQIANARPGLVRAILAIEPALGPTSPPSGSATAPYGITMHPLAYEPRLPAGELLGREEHPAPAGSGLHGYWLQSPPARRLPRLAGIPIAIVVGDASSYLGPGRCISEFLAQAGVANAFVPLSDVGIFGNGHMMMLEHNSSEIAAFLMRWLAANLAGS